MVFLETSPETGVVRLGRIGDIWCTEEKRQRRQSRHCGVSGPRGTAQYCTAQMYVSTGIQWRDIIVKGGGDARGQRLSGGMGDACARRASAGACTRTDPRPLQTTEFLYSLSWRYKYIFSDIGQSREASRPRERVNGVQVRNCCLWCDCAAAASSPSKPPCAIATPQRPRQTSSLQ